MRIINLIKDGGEKRAFVLEDQIESWTFFLGFFPITDLGSPFSCDQRIWINKMVNL